MNAFIVRNTWPSFSYRRFFFLFVAHPTMISIIVSYVIGFCSIFILSFNQATHHVHSYIDTKSYPIISYYIGLHHRWASYPNQSRVTVPNTFLSFFFVLLIIDFYVFNTKRSYFEFSNICISLNYHRLLFFPLFLRVNELYIQVQFSRSLHIILRPFIFIHLSMAQSKYFDFK